jgi:hypothetical protein
LNWGSEILKSTAELFGEAGYKYKEKEIIEKLNMVKKGEKIIISALNTIKEPPLFRSTVGIVSPICPIETSQSTRISEVRQFIEKATRVEPKKTKKYTEKSLLKAEISEEKRLIMESEIDFEERKFSCIVHKGVIHSTVYMCPNCNTFYCLKCASALKKIGENCWYCDFEFDI